MRNHHFLKKIRTFAQEEDSVCQGGSLPAVEPGHAEGDEDDDGEPEKKHVTRLPVVGAGDGCLAVQQSHHPLQIFYLVWEVPHNNLVSAHLRYDGGSQNLYKVPTGIGSSKSVTSRYRYGKRKNRH